MLLVTPTVKIKNLIVAALRRSLSVVLLVFRKNLNACYEILVFSAGNW